MEHHNITNKEDEVEKVPIVTVNVLAAKQLLTAGHQYLDVRTKGEFEKGHVVGAVNIPYVFITSEGREKNSEFLQQVTSIFNKDDEIIVGCMSGGRSLKASMDMLNTGFKHVKNMGGGFSSWTDNGFEVVEPSKPEA